MSEGAAAAPPGARIVALDIVRGVAVMGILAMNIVGFALPDAAYVNPLAAGHEGPADTLSWLVSFILVDGKMRGLFSVLFGASMLLVIDRAEASGEPAASVHFRRMGWLLLFGLLHLYLVWYGDILSLYAPIGMLAFLFRRAPTRLLLLAAATLLSLQLMLFIGIAASAAQAGAAVAADRADADTLALWDDLRQGFGRYTPDELSAALALHRGSWWGIVAANFATNAFLPLNMLFFLGAETLAYMLLGMAALRSGFLTGGWSGRAYARVVIGGLAIGLPAYGALAWWCLDAGFAVPVLVAAYLPATVPLRPPMIAAAAALAILATRRGGWLTGRIAAAGRAAFTNYLGASLVMTAIFDGWGLGLFGHVRRVELWLFVIGAWALMLLWSRPWLDRFRYGPFEWLWRSLARWSPQPMRRRPAPA